MRNSETIKARRSLHKDKDEKSSNDKKQIDNKIRSDPIYSMIGFYFLALVIFSLLRELEYVPSSYFGTKKNILNIYFAKLAWGWTLLVSVPFIIMTSYLLSNGKIKEVGKGILRIIVATAIWFVCTYLFEYLDNSTGKCTNQQLLSKRDCRMSKHDWIDSFDISGHTFLLMYSLLFFYEEVQAYFKFKEMLKGTQNKNTLLQQFVKINFFLIALLAIIWNVILVSTFLYHHTISHKLVAAVIAVFFWFVSYRVIFSDRNLRTDETKKV